MKTLLFAGCALACIALSGCAGFTVPGMTGGGAQGVNDAILKILTDPNCGHDDEAEVNIGAAGVPAFAHAKAARHCPMPTGAPLAVGAAAAPAKPATP